MNKFEYEIEYSLYDIITNNKEQSTVQEINNSLDKFISHLTNAVKDIIKETGKDFIKKYPFTYSIKFSVGTYYNDEDYSDVEARNVYAKIIYNDKEVAISAEDTESSWEDMLIYRPVTQEEVAYNEKAVTWMKENHELIEKFNSDLYSFYMLLDSINIILLEKAYNQSTIEITKDGVEFYDYEY